MWLLAFEMQQQASVCRFPVHLCINLCSVLDYFHANKGDLVINRKLHRERQAEVEAIKGSQKINCSISARHFGQGIINISLVQRHQRDVYKDIREKCSLVRYVAILRTLTSLRKN